MELLDPRVKVMLQFKVNTKIHVQRFDLDIKSVEILDEIEATPIKMLMSEYKKTLVVFSAIERHFCLEKALKSIGLCQSSSVKNTFSSSDVICAIFPINPYKYQLMLHAERLKPLKILFTKLYDVLPKDVIMDTLKTETQLDKRIDKKSCLLREITALKMGQFVDETVTDKVFLE